MTDETPPSSLHLKENLKGLQYGQIVKDARLRHEAFFKELGIN